MMAESCARGGAGGILGKNKVLTKSNAAVAQLWGGGGVTIRGGVAEL